MTDWLEEFCRNHGHPTMFEHDCLSNVIWPYGEQPRSLVGHQFEPLLDHIFRDVADLQPEERRILILKLVTEALSEPEKEVLAQALLDYTEGVSDNCEDESQCDQLLETVNSIEQKLLERPT